MLNFVYSSVDRKRFVFKVICSFFFDLPPEKNENYATLGGAI